MRREDEESDEEDEAWRNTTYMVAMAGVMAYEETEEQPLNGVALLLVALTNHEIERWRMRL